MTLIIQPRVHDLGGFQVRRAVPSLQARSVGPFVFVDHMGPAMFEAGRGVDVRPHPHIGLATVTFLWSGRVTHRDTLGSVRTSSPAT
jgi:redox-sensitive bicupin YhaK (pirin superfamily)